MTEDRRVKTKEASVDKLTTNGTLYDGTMTVAILRRRPRHYTLALHRAATSVEKVDM